MNQAAFRKLHRKIAPIIFIPLAVSAITGIAYVICESWFGISEEAIEIFMEIHQGEYLGDQLKPIYVMLVALGLIGMAVTGLVMTRLFSKARPAKIAKLDFRTIHRIAAPILFLPFLVSAITGVAYRIGKSWFGMSGDQGEILLAIHQGEYLGDFFLPIYVLLVGLGLLGMIVTGINMLGWFRKTKKNPS
ncbi:MAG: hypothetical protein Fur0025_48220 [Oscillatoriaceae cyanobacterium]